MVAALSQKGPSIKGGSLVAALGHKGPSIKGGSLLAALCQLKVVHVSKRTIT